MCQHTPTAACVVIKTAVCDAQLDPRRESELTDAALNRKEDWAVLDAEAAELKNATARMSDKIVEKLRDKAMSARVRTHDQFIHRYERSPPLRDMLLSSTLTLLCDSPYPLDDDVLPIGLLVSVFAMRNYW
eukprot:69369-Rhodomonas_salina.5